MIDLAPASIGQTDKSGRVGAIVVPGKTACIECIGINQITVLKEHLAAPLTGPLVSVLAGIVIHEFTKFIIGYAETKLLGNSFSVDSQTWEISHIPHVLNPNCPVCSYLQ